MALRLYWNSEQEGYTVTEEMSAKLNRLLELAGRQEAVEDGAVALTFVDDEAIREMNRDYRGIDRATDVLSFPQLEPGEDEPDINYDDLEVIEVLEGANDGSDGADSDNVEAEDFNAEEPLGDIVISLPRALAQAEEYGHSAEREIGFLFVHGFLHLIGFDHGNEEEERVMIDKQESILQAAGLTR